MIIEKWLIKNNVPVYLVAEINLNEVKELSLYDEKDNIIQLTSKDYLLLEERALEYYDEIKKEK